MHLGDEDSDLVFYVVLRAADRFQSQENRYPGARFAQASHGAQMVTFSLKARPWKTSTVINVC